MGRYLAIDYGTKRCGIAVTDPDRIISSGLDTVASHELMHFLSDYMKREHVDCVIFGKPMKTDQQVSESFIHVERFVRSFKRRFPEMRVEWHDERFTSKMAVASMIAAGMKKSDRRRRENIDKMSAAIILQSFLEEANNTE